MWLTSIAIRRPVFILMVFSALAVLGWTAASKMRVELNPNVNFPFVTIVTIYPGAGPREVETLISKPIEDAVNGINGVKNVTSVSQEGISVVSIEFNLGVNSSEAAADVREKVDAIRASLPRDALSPTISKFDINAVPVLYYGMSSERPSKQLRYIAEEIVTNRLARVPGVASVTVLGGDKREIRVEVDQGRLDAYGLNIMQVVQALQAANLNVPGGRIEEQRREYAIRVVGEFENLDQIRNVRIPVTNRMNPMAAPNVIHLSDVAQVKDGVAERTGQPAQHCGYHHHQSRRCQHGGGVRRGQEGDRPSEAGTSTGYRVCAHSGRVQVRAGEPDRPARGVVSGDIPRGIGGLSVLA